MQLNAFLAVLDTITAQIMHSMHSSISAAAAD